MGFPLGPPESFVPIVPQFGPGSLGFLVVPAVSSAVARSPGSVPPDSDFVPDFVWSDSLVLLGPVAPAPGFPADSGGPVVVVPVAFSVPRVSL